MVDQIKHVGSVTSTSDIIRGLWREHSAGDRRMPYTSVLADHQTKGRGRLGRTWTTPPKKALLMSTVVRVSPSALPWVSLLSGLAVQRAITDSSQPRRKPDPQPQQKHGIYLENEVQPKARPSRVDLKWPNDVLVNGKKVGGILSEYLGQPVTQDGSHFVSVGTGVNLTQTAGELPTPEATSLALEGDFRTDRQTFAEAVRSHLAWVFAQAEDPATLERLKNEYRSHCVTLGMNVTATLSNARITGAATAISADGHLLIEDRAGAIHTVQAGDVAEHHGPHLTYKKDPVKEFVA